MMLRLLTVSLLVTGCGAAASLDQKDKKTKEVLDADARRRIERTDACSASDVEQLTRPYYPGGTGTDTFTFTFNYEYKKAAAGKPTVVYIPGGPGQASIGEMADWNERLPDGYGVVLTDPRGVGCNDEGRDEFPVAFYKTAYVADDIAAAVKALGIDDYFVYGISYGTAVATVTASKLESDGTKAPKGVVLEGTLGRAFQGDEADRTYINLWDAKLAASPAKKAAFEAATLPLGYDATKWLNMIRLGLMYGEIESKGEAYDVLDRITDLAISSDPADQQKARDVFVSASGSDDDFDATSARVFYYVIACQEVFGDLSSSKLVSGHIVRDGDDLCRQAGLSFTADKFDAARWPIKAPIYYYQGENDPATPAVVAKYHFTAETSSTGRKMVTVGKGGHNPFELSLTTCYKPLWDSMAAGGGTLKATLDTCDWSPGVRITTATDAPTAF